MIETYYIEEDGVIKSIMMDEDAHELSVLEQGIKKDLILYNFRLNKKPIKIAGLRKAECELVFSILSERLK